MSQSKYLHLRATPYERAAIRALCAREELNFSDLMRYLLRREVDFRGIEVVVEEGEEEKDGAPA